MIVGCQEEVEIEPSDTAIQALKLSPSIADSEAKSYVSRALNADFLKFENIEQYSLIKSSLIAASNMELAEGYEYGDRLSKNESLDFLPKDYAEIRSKAANFKPYSETRSQQEDLRLEAGWLPSDVVADDYLIDVEEGMLVNEFGVVQVGDSIIILSPLAAYRGPEADFIDMVEAAFGGGTLPPTVVLQPRSTQCPGSVSVNVNHANRAAIFEWTGPDPTTSSNRSLTYEVSDFQNNSYTNQTSFSVTHPTFGRKQVCWVYEERGLREVFEITSTPIQITRDTVTIDTVVYDTIINYIDGVICRNTDCTPYRVGECNVGFNFTGEQDGLIQFTSTSSVPFGQITGYQWQFGDGATSTEQNPTHEFPCDDNFNVTLTIFGPQCENGSQSITREVEVSGFSCCDKNAQSPWLEATYNNEDRKIDYRFDLGSQGVEWANQRLKAKIKHFRKRNNGNWRRDRENIQAIFNGSLYGANEDGCTCRQPVDVQASPSTAVNRRTHTFRDPLATGWRDKENWLKINEADPIIIEYRAAGQTRVTQNTARANGFSCE